MSKLFTAIAVIVLVGCAAHPRNIAPASVSVTKYRDHSCEELRADRDIALQQRDAYVSRQKSNRTRDGLLNALVLPGLGAATSDHEDEVANSKGTVLALEREIARRCR